MDYLFLIDCYEKLFELISKESQLIKSETWEQLNDFSHEKEDIIKKIQEFESKNPSWKKETPGSLQVLICKVADLEQLNQNLVAECISQKKIQRGDLNQRIQKLQNLRHKYETFSNTDGFSEQA